MHGNTGEVSGKTRIRRYRVVRALTISYMLYAYLQDHYVVTFVDFTVFVMWNCSAHFNPLWSLIVDELVTTYIDIVDTGTQIYNGLHYNGYNC